METPKKEKLQNYLEGFKKLAIPGFFPIGAVVTEEKDRGEVLDLAQSNDFSVLSVSGVHPDLVLGELIGILQNAGRAVLDLSGPLPPKIFNQISSLSHNLINVNLPGQKDPVILNPPPLGGKVILLLNYDDYEDLVLQDALSSVCRLN